MKEMEMVMKKLKHIKVFILYLVFLLFLTSCSNVAELEATILEQDEQILELEIQLIEHAEVIFDNEAENEALLDDILELERQLGFWQNLNMENINSDFLSYITIDEGYALVGYFYESGYQLDFHIYVLRWYLESEARSEEMPWQWGEVVVVKNDEVLGTITSNNLRLSNDIHRRNISSIIELPAPFGGYNGILILGHSIGMWEYHELYLVQNGELVYAPEFSYASNPSFDFENQEITSVSPHYSGFNAFSVYHLIDGNLMEVERLILAGDERIAQIFIDGQWETQEYDEARWDRNFRGHWSAPGLFYSD